MTRRLLSLVEAEAREGLGGLDEAVAERAGVSAADLRRVKGGAVEEGIILKVAEVLRLGGKALVDSAKKAWYPQPQSMEGLTQFNTAYEDMTVNAYLVWDPKTREAAVFDTGADSSGMVRFAQENNLTIKLILLTHTHPDHVYGLPALVQGLLILGRTAPLPIYCRVEHVGLVERLLGLFGLSDEGLEVPVMPVEPRGGVRVLATSDLVMTASPNQHGSMPNLAVRLDAGERSVVYSSDTRPCPEVEALARGATALVHEATFARPNPAEWHSTAREAGAVALAAGVGRLYLAHVGYTVHGALRRHVAAARAGFGGPVTMAEELRWYRV
jgi:ribonuclease BN (tRNA processing enzyme)